MLPGRLHDVGVRPDRLVERAEDLGLRRAAAGGRGGRPRRRRRSTGPCARCSPARRRRRRGSRQARASAPPARRGRRRPASPRTCLAASSEATLRLTNRTSGFWKAVLARGGEVAVAGADADARRRPPGPARSRRASRWTRRRRRPAGGPSRIAPLPAWVSATGMPVASAKRAQLLGGLAVDHPAAGDDQRPPRGADHRDGAGERGRARAPGGRCARPAWRTAPRASRTPRPARPAAGDRHRTGLGRVGEHPHRAPSRACGSCSGPPDPVEEPRQRPEGVVHRMS